MFTGKAFDIVAGSLEDILDMSFALGGNSLSRSHQSFEPFYGSDLHSALGAFRCRFIISVESPYRSHVCICQILRIRHSSYAVFEIFGSNQLFDPLDTSIEFILKSLRHISLVFF